MELKVQERPQGSNSCEGEVFFGEYAGRDVETVAEVFCVPTRLLQGYRPRRSTSWAPYPAVRKADVRYDDTAMQDAIREAVVDNLLARLVVLDQELAALGVSV